jgi:cobalt-zinc-cadmium efflux system membrane fusion protein
MKIWGIPLISILLVLTGCGDNGHNTGTAAENHQHETENDTIHLSVEKQKEWNIHTIAAEIKELRAQIELPGVVTLNKNRTAHISSYVEGKVTEVKADLGTRAGKGAALAVINSPEFAQAQADFLEARAAYLLSRQEFERAEMLLKAKAIEKKEYDRRETAYQQASTRFGALGSALHSYGIDHDHIEELISKCESVESQPYKCEVADPFLPITTPISGTVVFRDIIIGEHIQPEKNIFTVTDLDRLWVELDAYEKDIPFLINGGDVSIQTSVYETEQFPGRITYISDVIDEKIRTVSVRVEVENRDRKLKPQMYVKGNILSPAAAQQLAVPEAAVQSLGEEKIVFIQAESDMFRIRRVKVQDLISGWVTIKSGLDPGEIIVHKGAFTLKSELTKGTFGHAHAH